MKEALTSNIGQISRQTFVFLLHCKVILAHIEEVFDNRLHQRYQKESAYRLWIRGQAQV
jgi:hypothetical protein